MNEISSDEIREWIGKSSKLLIKKLSRNDRSWADNPDNHQSGFYIPQEIREAGFFPPLHNVNRDKPHIFMTEIGTLWPSTGQIKISAIRHFSNKGSEMHFTRVPKEQFAGLTPASLLIGGRLKSPHHDAHYWFAVIDSSSDEAEMIETIFDLKADFHYGLFDPVVQQDQADELEELIEEIEEHLRSGTLPAFITSVAKLPPPETLASCAQRCYLDQYGLDKLDPYEIQCPGDAIMRISRDIEYSLYKRAELRHRAAQVIKIVTAGANGIVSAIVRGFPDLDAAFLSASQHRKSRAGRSFEQHIGRLLRDGKIKFDEQAVTGGRRPDFVLPSVNVLANKNRSPDDALILSAKTTLRERWKQVALEKFNCNLFLATVDDRVSSDAIDDMQRENICLVVPESLKNSDESSYASKGNVITFRDFFDNEVRQRRGMLLSDRGLLI
jgi:hypothetical protein